MKTRIITAIVAIAILIPVLIFSDTFLLPLMLSVCTIIGLYEMASCIGVKKNLFLTLPLYLLGAVLPFYMRYVTEKTAFPETGLGELRKYAFVALSLIAIYFFTVLTFSKGRVKFAEVSCLFFTSLYIMAGFSAILFLRDFTAGGEYVYLLVFISAWVTDTFAYFIGMLLGRHKLIPDVSPKKTVEGSIGGIVFCMLATVLFGFIITRVSSLEANYLLLVIAGFVISIISQIGDLCMSVIKRTYGIKDYGKLFPGHGGVLDRFDSILAVSIALAVFSSFFDFFTMVA